MDKNSTPLNYYIHKEVNHYRDFIKNLLTRDFKMKRSLYDLK